MTTLYKALQLSCQEVSKIDSELREKIFEAMKEILKTNVFVGSEFTTLLVTNKSFYEGMLTMYIWQRIEEIETLEEMEKL